VSLAKTIAICIQRATSRYQQRWIGAAIHHPYIAHLGGRQIRKDTTWAGHLIGSALTTPHKQWQAFNCTATKAQEFLDDCRKWYRLCVYGAHRAGQQIPALVKDNTTTLAFSNGSVIHSRPPTMRNVVGVRDSVLLNEAGVIPNAGELYEALYPIVREARGQGKDAQFIIISNACRVGLWWHTFFTQTVLGESSWHPITTTWEEAKKGQGWRTSRIKAEREAILRDISLPAFLQWYMCRWRSASEGFFEGSLLDASARDTSTHLTVDDWLRPQTFRPRS
jgi:hypothetical protein